METEALRLVFCGVFFFCFGLSAAAFIGSLVDYGSNKLRCTIYYVIMVLMSLVIAGLITTAVFGVSMVFRG
jgi:hypothetical protein